MLCSATVSSTTIWCLSLNGVVFTASSSEFSAILRSPPLAQARCFSALSVTTAGKSARPFSLFKAIFIAEIISSSLSGLNSKTRHLETIARVIDVNGFSVVEPIKIILPSSIADKTQSLCALLQRWHSSRSKYVCLPKKVLFFRASSIIALASLTPLDTAFSFLKSPFREFAIMLASVVFPVPGGP